MAAYSIRRSPNSRFWNVHFRTPDPDKPGALVQRTRSTKQEKRAEALTAARSIVEAAEKEAGAGSAIGRKIAELVREAATLAEAGKLNVAGGRDIVRRMLLAVGAGEMRSFTVRDWMGQWLASKGEENAKPGGKGGKAKAYSPATYARYSGNVKTFLATIPSEKANGDLSMLTTEDILHWRDALRKEGRTASTVNDATKAIRTALNAARREGLVVMNVAEAVPMLAEEDSIRVTFSPEDVARVIEAADANWKGVVLLGYYTGASLSDITRLRWKQIDLTAGTMTYARGKTGVGVGMPLHRAAMEWLTEQPATDDPEGFVFPELAGLRPGGRNGLSAMFAGIMERAGIYGRVVEPEGAAGYTRKALSFHCLRHTCISAMANAGVSQELRMALVGQTQAKTNEIYTHRELGTLRAAIELLPGLPEVAGPKE